MIYASAAAQQLQMYLAAFGKRYPFIKTEYFRTDKQKLVTRVLLEEQAKQRLADVVHTSVIETHILKKRGALSRYVPMESASYPSQYKDPEGYWTSVYASGTLMGFNTRQVKRAEAPKTLRRSLESALEERHRHRQHQDRVVLHAAQAQRPRLHGKTRGAKRPGHGRQYQFVEPARRRRVRHHGRRLRILRR